MCVWVRARRSWFVFFLWGGGCPAGCRPRCGLMCVWARARRFWFVFFFWGLSGSVQSTCWHTTRSLSFQLHFHSPSASTPLIPHSYTYYLTDTFPCYLGSMLVWFGGFLGRSERWLLHRTLMPPNSSTESRRLPNSYLSLLICNRHFHDWETIYLFKSWFWIL